MNFVNPGFLWTLFALLIPVVIHLFNFKKYKTIYFSSLTFLKSVDQQTKSTQKLKHLLILLSRILAFLFIIFAFAQPYLSTDSKNNGSSQPIVAIHIDNSFSMSMRGTEGELLSEAKEAARSLIKQAAFETKFILSTNSLSGTEEKIISKIDALDRIDNIDYSPIFRSSDQVLLWQEKSVSRNLKLSDRFSIAQCVFLSDFQDVNTQKTILLDSLEFKHILVKLSPQVYANTYIDSVWFSSPFIKSGLSNELFIRVVNSSDEELNNQELKFEVEDKKRNLFIDIPAHSKITTSIHYTDQNSGQKSGMVSITDKQYFVDDDFFFSYHVENETHVLICDGEDALPEIDAVYKLDNLYQTQVVQQSSFFKDHLINKDLVILNGINEFPSGFVNELIDFSNNNGSLVIIPGRNLIKSELNQLLQQLELPIFNNYIQKKSKLHKLNLEDEFFKSIFTKKNEKPALPGTNNFYSILNTNTSDAINLIEFSNGNPFLVKSNSNRKTFLFTSNPGTENSTLPNDAIFPTLFLRIGELSLKSIPLYSVIGSNELLNIPMQTNEGDQIHLTFNKFDVIPQQRSKGNITQISLGNIPDLVAGNYKLKTENNERTISMNYDRRESNVKSEKFDLFVNKLEESGMDNIDVMEIQQSFEKETIALQKPIEYWKWCLIIALLFILAEVVLILFWKPIIRK